MRCTNWRIGNSIAWLGAALFFLAGGGADAQPVPQMAEIDDAVVGKAMLGRFDYVGNWQHVHGKHDGRSNGTSTRSTRTGDVAILGFYGTRIRLFGVKGPSGGRAGVALDDASITGAHPIDFYAPRIQTHALMFESAVLPAGIHTITVVVWGTRNERGRYYYVNLDGAEVEAAAPTQ